MSRRRRRGRNAAQTNSNTPAKQGGQSKGGSKSKSQQQRKRRRNKKQDHRIFWGDPDLLPAEKSDVRITTDPAAVPRSLGPPPLAGHDAIAEHYFAAVYDRAVTTAGALAAAGGIIEPEELIEELGE